MLRQIGQQAGFRVVLSSRGAELVQAMAGGHLDGAAALELVPVDATQAANYLRLRVVHPTPASWDAVIRHLDADRGSALARALDTPLMLSLLLESYLASPDPVDELTDPRRFPAQQGIEDHLLDRIPPTAYAPRPGSPVPSYSLQQAQCWLGYLAAQMTREGTRDLAWWRIARWKPARPRALAFGLVLGLVDGLVFGLMFGLVFGFTGGLVGGLMFGLVGGLLVGPASPPDRGYL